VKELEKAVWGKNLDGHIGVGHTRWATHGRPSEENAHPHTDCSGEIVVVHNGIIENYLSIKRDLQAEGHRFKSETDTEVIAHLIERYLQQDLEEAVRKALQEVKGAYAISVLWRKDERHMVGARCGSPLIVGLGEGEFFLASDIPAILSHTRNVLFLNDEEMATLSPEGVNVTNLAGEEVSPCVQKILWDPVMAEKGGYKHYMLKEIYEQPRSFRDTIRGRFSQETGEIFFEDMEVIAEATEKAKKIFLVACGTSWHASLVGKFMIEECSRIPVEVDYGSEFRYRNPILDEESLVVPVSQSGETMDTLASVKLAKERKAWIVSICNVVGSSIPRESHASIFTHAGPEIGVASTKAFTSQLAALYLLALYLGQKRKLLDGAKGKEMLEDLIKLPQQLESLLRQGEELERLSHQFHAKRHFLYLGRGINYPVALEGALKLKEISYIHAEGYPAGEMKHGPIALIDEQMPVVVLAPQDRRTYEKILANIEEVKTRDGIVIAFGNEGDQQLGKRVDHLFTVPRTSPLLTPILFSLPLQLLAYYIAVRKGCDVDQPRNLAKSVTVE
ncbi:MAG: glutamine--fructose-6-phosphate transaminase (isomerizing), partial [candidate division NC10 bacterium]|nr:glutamine--fructose-6-phosphate transaminase (isomerizing) [candidate division NC10 bacterium]